MNIEIANRLVNLRKSNSLSQEALAEKLGISRQAVSKWERAEASPDTDNLILLARLYGVSLDELLRTEDEIPRPEEISYVEDEKKESAKDNGEDDDTELPYSEREEKAEKEYVHIGLDGIHVKDDESEVHVGWKGIHVIDKENQRDGTEVHIDKSGVFVDGKEYDGVFHTWIKPEFPYIAVAMAAYIILGLLYGTWGIGLVLILAAPLVESFFKMIGKRRLKEFNYALLTVIVFILLGYYRNMWHPGWILFLTIPLYYSMINYFSCLWAVHKRKKDGFEQ